VAISPITCTLGQRLGQESVAPDPVVVDPLLGGGRPAGRPRHARNVDDGVEALETAAGDGPSVGIPLLLTVARLVPPSRTISWPCVARSRATTEPIRSPEPATSTRIVRSSELGAQSGTFAHRPFAANWASEASARAPVLAGSSIAGGVARLHQEGGPIPSRCQAFALRTGRAAARGPTGLSPRPSRIRSGTARHTGTSPPCGQHGCRPGLRATGPWGAGRETGAF
jgi:hypothetical protein